MIIKHLNINKASGSDGIGNAHLKHLPENAIDILTATINESWRQGKFPSTWKHAVICPIQKRYPATEPSAYRPISLLNTMGKVMESLVTKRLTYFIEANKLLPKEQFGFRQKTSTTHALFNLTNNIHKHIHSDEKAGTTAILLDITAAYDSVNRSHLCKRLEEMKVPSRITNWLRNFLINRKSCTRALLPDGTRRYSDDRVFHHLHINSFRHN